MEDHVIDFEVLSGGGGHLTESVVVLGLLQGGREVEAPTGHAQTLADVNIPFARLRVWVGVIHRHAAPLLQSPLTGRNTALP